MTRNQNLALFRGLNRKAQDVLGSFRRDAERDIDGLVATSPSSRILTRSAFEENQRIHRLERTVLPFGDRLQNRVGDRRDQVRRDLKSIKFKQMPLDLAHRHAARIHRHESRPRKFGQ